MLQTFQIHSKHTLLRMYPNTLMHCFTVTLIWYTLIDTLIGYIVSHIINKRVFIIFEFDIGKIITSLHY